MQLSQSTIRKIFIHFLVWIFYIFYELLTILLIDNPTYNLWETFLNFTLYAALFYTNALVLLPKFYSKKKYVYLVISLLFTIALFAFLRYLLKLYVIPLFGKELIHPFISVNKFIAESVWRGGYFIMLSFGFWFATNLIKIEKEKRKVEVDLLKSQINPHFLFNSLNFFYSQVHTVSEKTAKGILLLSDIMRYSMQDDFNGKVMLEEEVKHIKNFIAMKQLRFDNKLQVEFNITGNIQFRMIVPLILITLVENCFKHGDAEDAQNPIIINLTVDNDFLIFDSLNKKRALPAENSTGIGVKNTVKRLNAIYGTKNYSFKTEDKGNYFSYKLKIKL